MTQLLLKWLQQGPKPQQLISFNHHDIITGEVFCAQVCHYQQLLAAHPAQCILLASHNSATFAVGLCAALLAGKTLVLPANTQAGTLAQLQSHFELILSDETLSSDPHLLLNMEINYPKQAWPQTKQLGQLQLFTSGSSGQAKAISKTLAQLDNEVSTLERTFADKLPQCSVIATVSHQHIYGLLFKILWPLAAGRAFLSEQIEYPENLSYYMALMPHLCLISSPAQLSRLPAALDFQAQQHCPSLIFSSGGPLSFEQAQAVAQCYGQLPTEVFGSTETGGIAYRKQLSPQQTWQPFSDVKVDADDDGALLLQSPYLSDSQQIRCDDKIKLQANGQFLLAGRLDRIVKIEEKRVSLPQMELKLSQHLWVNQAAVVLLNHPKPQLAAIVELSAEGDDILAKKGKLFINNAFKQFLLNEFERVTLPKRWRYPELLPTNSQGKRITQELIELFNHD